MIKMVFLVHKRSDMDTEEFSRYWRETHAAIGAKLPGLRKYVQNHSIAAPDGTPASYDGFAELWFDDVASLEQAMASPEGEAVVADLENFLDVASMQAFSVDEVTVI